MPRFRTVALAGTTAALLLLPTAAYAEGGSSSRPRLAYAYSADRLSDLDPTTTSPFDQASARVLMVGYRNSAFSLRLRGIDKSKAGQSYGAHLHVGPCVAGAPSTAGPHYNLDAVRGVTPVVASDQTEVWLDFTVDADGEARSSTTIPFVPDAGERAIVIHAEETAPNGTAGARLACLPLTIH